MDPHFVKGAWNADCDRCGFTFKNTSIKLEWTGLRCCSGEGTNNCWEERHPQESLRGKRDRQAPPWTAGGDEGPDVSVETGTPVQASDL